MAMLHETSPPRETHRSERCEACGTRPLTMFVSRGQVVMWKCPACEMYQNGMLFTPEQYDGAYDKTYAPRLASKTYVGAYRLNRLAAVLDTDQPRLLEIGCSLGATLEAARLRGWSVTGVDVSKEAVNKCRERGFECVSIDGEHLPFPEKSFDAVTAWHVIEHVADVRRTLAEWRRVLRPGGVMALETPDGSSPMVRRRGANYSNFWCPAHTYVFSFKNLSRLIEESGFELVQQPIVGRLGQLTAAQACFTLGYIALESLKNATGTKKAFQVFARRIEK